MTIIASSNGAGMAASWEMPQGGGSALDAVEVRTPCIPRQLVWGPAIALFETQSSPAPHPCKPVHPQGDDKLEHISMLCAERHTLRSSDRGCRGDFPDIGASGDRPGLRHPAPGKSSTMGFDLSNTRRATPHPRTVTSHLLVVPDTG